MSERRVSLAEYCPFEPLKPTESQTEQLYLSSFAGGTNPLLFIRQQGGMFSPDGFLVQVSPMRANICSAKVSLSKTLQPPTSFIHGCHCAAAARSILYPNTHCYSCGFIKVHVAAVVFALSENDKRCTFDTSGQTLSGPSKAAVLCGHWYCKPPITIHLATSDSTKDYTFFMWQHVV